jgi:hypothetical protein
VWQLVRTPDPYPDAAVDVLVRWVDDLPDLDLAPAERDQLIEGTVRALSTRQARPAAAPALLRLFRRTGYPLQWVVGSALEITTTPAHLDDVLDLVADRAHGQSRQLLVLALRRIGRRDPRVPGVLLDLVDDDDVAAQAISVLATLRPDLVVEPATRKRDHPVPGVRQAARKALRAHAPPDRVGPPRPST